MQNESSIFDMKPLPFTCIFSVLERAGCTPLSALHRYFPEYSARANSSLKEPFPRTIGSSTPPSEVSVLPLQIKISYFEIEILLIIKQYFFMFYQRTWSNISWEQDGPLRHNL